jgi:hypothetical protein
MESLFVRKVLKRDDDGDGGLEGNSCLAALFPSVAGGVAVLALTGAVPLSCWGSSSRGTAA